MPVQIRLAVPEFIFVYRQALTDKCGLNAVYWKKEETTLLMPPDNSRRPNPQIPKRTYLHPTVHAGVQSARGQATNDAAAGVVRGQIENIYQQNADPEASDDAEQLAKAQAFARASHVSEDSPYNRTHEDDRTEIQEDQWKQYHSAWQDYYQQYYERHYLGEVYRMRQTIETHAATTSQDGRQEAPDETPENDAAYRTLKADLLGNVRESAVQARSSKHFMPFLAAGLTMILFLFLQYNRVLFANVEAYVSPGSINPANIIVDPNLSVPVSQEPRLIIPKINVDVPVVYDTRPDQASQLQAMEQGVAWFGIPGANSRPGQVGNTVLSGHSSNDLFDPGDYKFIFARLEQLVENDTFYVNYLGARYTYSITKKEVVRPTDVQKLVYDTGGKPVMTLITCVPLGTAQNRLLVTAEQISPNPLEAAAAPSEEAATKQAAMPGNSPTLLSRLFGL